MKCTCSQELIESFLDDELDANRRADLEVHLDACGDCAILHEHLHKLRDDIRKLAPRYTAPARLQQLVLTDLRASNRRESRMRGQTWRVLAMAATVLLTVSLAWDIKLVRSRQPDRDVVAREIVSSHIRSLIGTHLMDVPSSDQHTVKPWFNGKLDFSPDVKDFATQGFPLIGGRAEYLNNRSVAALVYQRRGHIINLLTWPSSSSVTSRTALNEHGYNLIHWTAARMNYWAISDLNNSELEQFVGLYD